MRLLKKHLITVRNLRRETPTKLTLAQGVAAKTTVKNAASTTAKAALVALISLSTTQGLLAQDQWVAQDSLPVPSAAAQTVKLSDLPREVASKIKSEHYAVQDQNIQQAYHQQLQENRQRSAISAQRAVFEHAASNGGQVGGFSPAAYHAPTGASTVAQASHNAAFPRTAANQPDQYINQPSAPTPTAAYSPPSSAGYAAPSPEAYSAPASAGNAAPQTFMPPVHIPPMQPQYSSGIQGRSINGRRNAVQNFAPQANRQHTVAHTSHQPPVSRVQRNERPVQPRRAKAQRATQENTHVFLQDRIANALGRRFKRGRKSNERTSTEQLAIDESVDTAPESVLETEELTPTDHQDHSTAPDYQQAEIVIDDYQPVSHADDTIVRSEKFDDEPSYSEILRSNKYTSRIKGKSVDSNHRPADHRIAAKLDARQRSIERSIAHDNNEIEPFELSVNEEAPTIFDRYEEIRQTSAEHRTPPKRQPRRSSVKPRSRVAAYSKPDKYSRTRKRVSGENVSVLLQEEEKANSSPFADAEDFKPGTDIELESDLRQGSGTKNRPDRRNDLRDRDRFEDSEREDRVRSRLDDELDLEELDREIDEALDEELNDDEFENGRPNRAPRKSCIEFQDELIAGSIRDIALDISPPAASEGAQYGGLARTWTDRRGNTLATGALVDLRRGYVILDNGQKLAYSRLSQADLAAVSEFWRLPEVCVIGNRGGSPYRDWTPQVVTWKASNLCHKPLYFENTQLERYGHSRGPIAQPIHSTLHFFTRLVAVPYMTGICPPNECEYALGYYRPGNCAPWLREPIPISLEGIRREALFVTGAAFIP